MDTTDVDTFVEMRVVPLRDLTMFPGNARRGDVVSLAQSIKRNGQYRALIVRDMGDGRLIIVAGNHTWQALRAAGRKMGRVEIHEMTDEQARRINLADNRHNELGTNDRDALVELISYLDGDYEGTGYTEKDVDDLLNPPPPPDGPDEEGEPDGVVLAYNLVFDNDVQQAAWFDFMKALRRRYPDLLTTAERLHAHIGALEASAR